MVDLSVILQSLQLLSVASHHLTDSCTAAQQTCQQLRVGKEPTAAVATQVTDGITVLLYCDARTCKACDIHQCPPLTSISGLDWQTISDPLPTTMQVIVISRKDFLPLVFSGRRGAHTGRAVTERGTWLVPGYGTGCQLKYTQLKKTTGRAGQLHYMYVRLTV